MTECSLYSGAGMQSLSVWTFKLDDLTWSQLSDSVHSVHCPVGSASELRPMNSNQGHQENLEDGAVETYYVYYLAM